MKKSFSIKTPPPKNGDRKELLNLIVFEWMQSMTRREKGKRLKRECLRNLRIPFVCWLRWICESSLAVNECINIFDS